MKDNRETSQVPVQSVLTQVERGGEVACREVPLQVSLFGLSVSFFAEPGS